MTARHAFHGLEVTPLPDEFIGEAVLGIDETNRFYLMPHPTRTNRSLLVVVPVENLIDGSYALALDRDEDLDGEAIDPTTYLTGRLAVLPPGLQSNAIIYIDGLGYHSYWDDDSDHIILSVDENLPSATIMSPPLEDGATVRVVVAFTLPASEANRGWRSLPSLTESVLCRLEEVVGDDDDAYVPENIAGSAFVADDDDLTFTFSRGEALALLAMLKHGREFVADSLDMGSVPDDMVGDEESHIEILDSIVLPRLETALDIPSTL